MPKPFWRDDADCNSYPSEVFYGTLEKPLSAKESRMAKEICGACPVRRDCLITALRDKEEHGIWAGTTRLERRRMLRESGNDWRSAMQRWESSLQGRKMSA